ncbi:MAG TPA: ferredoxin reductase family protein [Natronosporangium sp.]
MQPTAASAQLRRARIPPGVVARWTLWGFLVLNVGIVELLFATGGAGKNSTLTVAKFFGLHAAMLMMLQVLLISRLPWLDRRIGMDRLTAWHRWVGFSLLWTVLAHATFVILGYARLSNLAIFPTFLSLAGVMASLLGMLAVATLILVATISLRYARRRLPYEVWHGLHILVYVAIGLALVHQFLEGTTFTATTLSTVYWVGLWVSVLTALVVGRIGLPLWRNAYHRFRVAAVVPEADDVTSVHVTGRHLERLPARAGQFFIWRFLGHNHWWQANPFSMSAAPNGRSLRLTAKAVGTTSAGLRRVPIGTRVFAEGPYGAFTALHRTMDRALLIAGGVGITPIRALLEEMACPMVVLYRVRQPGEAVLLGELAALARARGAQLHLLTGRTGAGSPPFQPFAPEHLRALVPDIAERDVFVCGPPAMTDQVIRSLRALKLPGSQIHAERFSLA